MNHLEESLTKARILIVEDEQIVALDIRSRLERLGYQVVEVASSGGEAIRKATELRPDLVLMDIRLQGEMDGVTAAGHIMEELDIPVVYLTAFADDATLSRATMTGPAGYVLKPFEDRRLEIAVEVAIHKHESERKVRESENRFRRAVMGAPFPIMIHSEDGRVVAINEVWTELSGYSHGDIPSVAAWTEQAYGHQGESIKTRIDGLYRLDEAVDEGRFVITTQDGRERTWEFSSAPLGWDPSGRRLVISMARDVTEKVQADSALRQYMRELEARNEELDAFAHTVAHDLKAPLGYVVSYAELLEADLGLMEEDQLRKGLISIADRGHRMATVIEDLLTLASVRKMEEVELSPLDMGFILAEVQEYLRLIIEEHDPELVYPAVWPTAQGYAPWVRVVWSNYISNAIKYSSDSPRIELGAYKEPGGMVRFWVRDNGPGIPPEDLTRLFTPFTRLEQMPGRGHGLGLSIVRRIIERLGGQVGVESRQGEGSTFSFTLPLAA